MKTRRGPVIVRKSTSANDSQAFGPGDRVKAKVLEANSSGLMLELAGGKKGVIEPSEFQGEQPAAGADLEVTYLIHDSNADLSLCTLREASDKVDLKSVRPGELLKARVTELGSEGIALDISGVRAFIPMSQFGRGLSSIPREFQRSQIVAEVGSVRTKGKRKDITLSPRRLLDRRDEAAKREALSKFSTGQAVTGKVVRRNEHGAFIDLGGIDGLLHISKIQKNLMEDEKAQKIEVGEDVSLLVWTIDEKRCRIGLAYPKSEEEAAEEEVVDVLADYEVGEQITALVNSAKDSGYTVLLGDGVQGWIPAESCSGASLKAGSLVKTEVSSIDSRKRKVELKIV